MSSSNGFYDDVWNRHGERVLGTEEIVLESVEFAYEHENGQINGTQKIVTSVELNVASSLEKVQNLETFLIHVASVAGDFEVLAVENKDVLADCEEKAMEFDFLSCILHSETEELDIFMNSIKEDIISVREKIWTDEFSEFSFKLDEAEEALKQLQDQLSEMRTLAAKYKRTLSCVSPQIGNHCPLNSEDGKYVAPNTAAKSQMYDQQRHILKMLENSLSRDIDLERKLCAARHSEEELKFRLSYAEDELSSMERTVENLSQENFRAENLVETLKGNLSEVVGNLQILQLQFNSSLRREGEARSALVETEAKLLAKEKCLKEQTVQYRELENKLALETKQLEDKVKETEDKYNLASTKLSFLKGKLESAEHLLADSDIRVENAVDIAEERFRVSEALINDLNNKIIASEKKADDAEAQYLLLSETKHKLAEELEYLTKKTELMEVSLLENGKSEAKLKEAESRCSLVNSEATILKEKLKLLEEKLSDTEVHLQNSVSSAGARVKLINTLRTKIADKEELICELYLKVSDSEKKAEESEAKCALLSQTNTELNEELEYFKEKVKRLGDSLSQFESEKTVITKDINDKSNAILSLVNELGEERQLLQLQISLLVKENTILAAKSWERATDDSAAVDESVFENERNKGADMPQVSEGSGTRSLCEQVKVDSLAEVTSGPICGTDSSDVDEVKLSSTTSTVRTLEPGQLPLNFVVAFVVFLMAIGVLYLLQLEHCPF